MKEPENNEDSSEAEVEKAIEDLKKALEANPNDFDTLYNLANVYFTRGNFEEAIKNYRRAIDIEGGRSAVYYNLGVALYENGDYKGASENYAKAIGLEPGKAIYHNNLGFALSKLELVDEAAVHYRKAIELKPNYKRAYYNLGNALFEKHMIEEAIKCYKKVADLDPEDGLVYFSLGKSYEAKGSLKDAMKNYEKAHKKNPLREIQKKIDEIKGRMTETPKDNDKEMVEKTLVESERDADREYNIGNTARDRGNFDVAIFHYKKAIDINPKHKWAYNALGNALRKKGDLDGAIEAYEKAISLDPEIAMFCYNLGCVMHFDNVDSEGALRQFEKAISLDPKYVNAFNSIGCVYLDHHKDYGEAASYFKKAVKLDPEYPYSYYNIGLCYQKMGDLQKAYKHFKKAYKLRPERKNYKEKVEELEQGLGMDIPYEEPDINFADVGGLGDVKEKIRELIIYPLKKPELAKKFGKRIGGGVLLYGPPGCGKTYLARATAGECEVPLFNIGIHDLVDKWHGNTEKNIHEVFERVKKSTPSILFLDEIDAVGGRRDSMQQRFEKMEVNQLLTEMDELHVVDTNVLVIAATNSPWDVDPALRRTGRFTNSLFIPEPDGKARNEVFQIHSRNLPVSKKIDWKELSKATDGYAASDIEEICDAAATIPWKEALKSGKTREISMDDFREAVKNRESSLPAWFKMAQTQISGAGEKKMYKRLTQAIKDYNSKYEDVEGYR